VPRGHPSGSGEIHYTAFGSAVRIARFTMLAETAALACVWMRRRESRNTNFRPPCR
jgi:hypothetical protein